MINKIIKCLKALILQPLEGLAIRLLLVLFSSMSAEKASALSGYFSRKIGPFTRAHKTGRANLEKAFPENSYEQNSQILNSIWENFGRIMGEYAHLSQIDIYNDPRFEIVGAEHIDALKKDGKPGIIFAAHMASWEVAIMGMSQRGLMVTQTYRAWNNPYVDKIVRHVQEGIGKELLAKGSQDGRRIIELLKAGEHLFLLVDQKFNRGVAVPFFGRDAMTAPAAARLAIKYDCPLLPARVERLEGFKFRITYYPPLDVSNSGDLKTDIYETLCKMNKSIEDWARERPGQWLWIHNRWPKT